MIELRHELAVGGTGSVEVLVPLGQAEPQVRCLLLKMGDLLLQGVDVGGGAEARFAPGLLAERFGQALFELPDAGGEPQCPFVCREQVRPQGRAGDARPGGAVAGGGRGGFEGVDLLQQVAVPVEECAVDAGFSELKTIIDIDRLMAAFRTHG